MFFSALAACISFFRKALQSYNLYFIPANFLAKIFVISFRLSRRRRSSKASAKVDTFPITSKYFRNFFLKIFHRPDIPTLLYNIREKDRQKNNDATPRNRAPTIKKISSPMKKIYSPINKKRLFDEKKIFVQAKKSQE
jgi:hypothetical protein